jgi:uncharacterized protein (TIGR02246 family)
MEGDMSRPASTDFRSAIEKAIAMWERAFNAKDAAGVANLYLEDASLLPPGSPAIKGRANIQTFIQDFVNAGGSDAKLRIVDVQTAGDMAYEMGAFEANMPQPQGGTARQAGKYVVVWKLQLDGSAKIAVDIFNGNS